jgi:hypothetical protein
MGSNWETKDFGLGKGFVSWHNANVTEQASIRVSTLTFFALISLVGVGGAIHIRSSSVLSSAPRRR